MSCYVYVLYVYGASNHGDTISKHVQRVVPGITFLSGGQSEEDALVNLIATNVLNVEESWAARTLRASELKERRRVLIKNPV